MMKCMKLQWIVVLVAMLSLQSCGGKGSDRTLTVSIEPQRYLLERIAGDGWKVNTMLANGADPENFDPPMSAMKAAMGSAAYFRIGYMPFENALIDRMAEGGGGNLRIVDSSEGIELLHGTHECDSHDGHDGDLDPHVWSSVKNAGVIAANMCRALVELDPDNARLYEENYRHLQAELDSLDSEITRKLAPKTGATFVTWHPSLSYFARDYSLRQLSLGSEGKEMSAEAFRDKIDEARNAGAEVMIVQPEVDLTRSLEVARQAGVRAVEVNLLGYDWPEQMRRVAEAID